MSDPRRLPNLPAATPTAEDLIYLEQDGVSSRAALGDLPLATAATEALAGKQPLDADLTAIAALSTTSYGRSLLTTASTGALKTALGVSNVDNTSDAGKPVSTAMQAALDGKQPVDADLTAIAALSTTNYGRSLLTMADAAAVKASLAITASNISEFSSAADARIAVQKGAPLGIAPLAADNRIDTVHLPDSILGALKYQSTWNASTNSPAIPTAATSNKGWYYKVATAGTTSVAGIAEWAVGDWIISNGASWDKIDNTDAVSSVAGLNGTITASSLKTALSITPADLSGLGSGIATFMGTPNSANLRAALADESGTGALLFRGGNIGAATGDSLSLSGGVNGAQILSVQNTTDGTSAYGELRVGNSVDATLTQLISFAPSSTIGGVGSHYPPGGSALLARGAGGLCIVALDGGGDVRLFAGAGTVGLTVKATGGIAVPSVAAFGTGLGGASQIGVIGPTGYASTSGAVLEVRTYFAATTWGLYGDNSETLHLQTKTTNQGLTIQPGGQAAFTGSLSVNGATIAGNGLAVAGTFATTAGINAFGSGGAAAISNGIYTSAAPTQNTIGIAGGGSQYANLMADVRLSSGGVFSYGITGETAMRMEMSAGFNFWTGGTGTAGATVESWTQLARLSLNGDLSLGTQPPNTYAGYKVLTVGGSTGGDVDFEASGTLVGSIFANASEVTITSQAAIPIRFRHNGTYVAQTNSVGFEVLGRLKHAGEYCDSGVLPTCTSGTWYSTGYSTGNMNGVWRAHASGNDGVCVGRVWEFFRDRGNGHFYDSYLLPAASYLEFRIVSQILEIRHTTGMTSPNIYWTVSRLGNHDN